ncbi:MAG: hypothetical protein Kow0031_28970 [Anaerolineae bacterium]
MGKIKRDFASKGYNPYRKIQHPEIMNRFDLTAIKQNNDLRDLAARFTALTGRGSARRGPCPKCKGHDRFVVYADKFLCRHCHPTYGDAIEFAAWLNDCDFRQAVNWLTNGNPPTLAEATPGRAVGMPRPLLRPPAAAWQERAAAFVGWSQANLWQPAGRAGLDYLLNRGLTEATIRAAGLGYNPRDITDTAARWGIANRKTVWLPGPGVVIPWAIDGSLHRVNIRLLEPRQIRRKNGRVDSLKYIGPAGWSGANPLYNADAITPRQPVLLVEGEFCALTVTQEAGDLITAAATGSKDAAQAGRWIARLAAAPLVLLALDAEAGKGDAAARRWAKLLPHNTRRWRPLLKDINDMHRAGLNVRQWIEAALPAEPPVFKVMTWPPDTPTVALPRYTRLPDGRIKTVYQTEAEFRDSVITLALLKEATALGGKIVGSE